MCSYPQDQLKTSIFSRLKKKARKAATAFYVSHIFLCLIKAQERIGLTTAEVLSDLDYPFDLVRSNGHGNFQTMNVIIIG